MSHGLQSRPKSSVVLDFVLRPNIFVRIYIRSNIYSLNIYLPNSLRVFLEFEGRIISAVLSFEQSVQGYKLSNNSDRVAAAPCGRHGFMAVNMSRVNCQRQQLCSRVPPTLYDDMGLQLVGLVPVASDTSCRTVRSGGVLLTYYLLVRPACIKKS